MSGLPGRIVSGLPEPTVSGVSGRLPSCRALGIGSHHVRECGIDAFLLVKPDGVRLGLTGEVERAVVTAGLRISERRLITLSVADVRALWAEYDDSGHSLTLAFLDRYLTGGPSEILLVSGPDAFEAARRVKREIRSRHADGPFANVIHAAEQPAELTRQRDHLMGVATVAARPPARPRGMDFREYADVGALAGDLWPLIQGPPPFPGPFRLDGAVSDRAVSERAMSDRAMSDRAISERTKSERSITDRAVFLGPDREHTLDSTVTALWHALPGVELDRAVLLALHAGYSGGSPVAVGGRAALRRCLRSLREHGIRNCGPGRLQPARTAEKSRPDQEKEKPARRREETRQEKPARPGAEKPARPGAEKPARPGAEEPGLASGRESGITPA